MLSNVVHIENDGKKYTKDKIIAAKSCLCEHSRHSIQILSSSSDYGSVISAVIYMVVFTNTFSFLSSD